MMRVLSIDTTPSMLYTNPTSKSQTNNSYDYEIFIIVIILTTYQKNA